MAVLWDKLVEGYNYCNYEMMDPRNKDVFFVRTPWVWVSIVVLYNCFVTKLGPRLMKGRPPYQLDGIMKIYNIAHIASNLFIFVKGLSLFLHEEVNIRCMPLEVQNKEWDAQVSWLGYCYFWSKVADLLDTVFFVLRKKFSQVTFLHVYHHSIMVMAAWIALKYIPGGNPALTVLINSFVHTVMYSYYLLTSYNSEYKKSIWWKKHLTQLQMAQFFFLGAHSGQVLIWNPCRFPIGWIWIYVIQNGFVFILFYDFYLKTYVKRKSS